MGFVQVEGVMMRLILLLIAIAFGADAYFYSGTWTKAAVHGITAQVQSLTSGHSTITKGETPQRAARDGEAK